MRLSLEKHDPGYCYEALRAKVFLDGVKQEYAITADEALGYVIRYKLNELGVMFLDGDLFVTEQVFGRVELKVPDE